MSDPGSRGVGDFLVERLPFLGYLREFGFSKGRMALAMMFAIVKHCPVIVIPLYTAYIIDNLIPAEDVTGLVICLVGMVSLLIINITAHPLYVHFYSRVRHEVALRLRAIVAL